MVPPSIGSGCAKTTTARASTGGTFSSASSGPEGPGNSRTVSATRSPSCISRVVRRHECVENARQLLRTGDDAQVARAAQDLHARMGPQRRVLARDRRRHAVVEVVLTGTDQ